MSENKIKAYIGQKVAVLVENFLKTTPEFGLFNYRRNESAMKYNNYCWMTACSHGGNKFGFGFEFLGSSNRLGFYTVNSDGVQEDCFIWEYPDVLVDALSRSHPRMIPSSLMIELWRYFVREMTKGNIQSEYKRFLASLHHQNEKIDLNICYGIASMPQIYEDATKNIHDLKEASESLGIPIDTSCQSLYRFPDQEEVINCILNQGLTKNNKERKVMIIPGIKNVLFNEVKKTTTVVFNDRTSVIVKCTDNDKFDPEMGLAMALARKYFGSRTKLRNAVVKWVKASAPKNEQLKKKAVRKAEKEAAKIEYLKAQSESYME